MRISIVGSGMIAKEVIGMLLTEADGISITSIYSHSDRSKADLLARENDVPKVYDDYKRLLDEDDADFIYVGLVNTAHYDYVRQALIAGRNVIVEKPFCMTYEQAQELVDIARKSRLYLFEAVSLLHTPNFKFVQKSLHDIEPLRLIQCNYSQYSSRYDRYKNHDVAPAFNPELGGGALRDLNIYNLNAVVGLLGVPVSSHYYANYGYNGVDTSGVAVLTYPTLTAACTAAKDSSSPSFIYIQGENGCISIGGTPNVFGKVAITKKGETSTYQLNQYPCRLTHEFMEFKQIWENKDYALMCHYQDVSLNVMRVLADLVK